MSDRESHQASIDASEASIPAENGSREVENDPPPLGSDEERESDPGVAARTHFHRTSRARISSIMLALQLLRRGRIPRRNSHQRALLNRQRISNPQ